MSRVEIVAVGNELLDGDTQDRDVHVLCRSVAGIGARVERVAIVRDDVEIIAQAIRDALGRRATLLLTAGGLGPTPDDLTLAGVARAVGRDLRLDPSALEFVARRYAELVRDGVIDDPTMSPPREKLARLPTGSVWLPNEVGTAPGVVVEADGATIVSLPGPPAELEGILSGPLKPLLERVLGPATVCRARYRLSLRDETDFARIHERVQPAHPHVYVKSHPPPMRREQPPLLVTLTARGSDEREARYRLHAAKRDLERACRDAGIDLSEEA